MTRDEEARLETLRRIDEILADLPAFNAKLDAEVRAQYPDMTEEQHEAQRGLVAKLFGI